MNITSCRLKKEHRNKAARTLPGRENGGNCEIKNLSRGSKIYLLDFVESANLSTCDMQFSQGDGEISFCGFLELKYINTYGTLKRNLIS